MDKEYKQQFKEFCEIFKGLNVSQAINKAKEMDLDYTEDYDLVDIDYKFICASVYDREGIGHISTSIEVWNAYGTDYKIIEMEG